MDLIWKERLLSTLAVWKELSKTDRKQVSRMTVQVQLNRLVEKGWLKKEKIDGRFQYSSTQKELEVKQEEAGRIIDQLFDSSLANFVSCLKGSNQINQDEIAKIRDLLDDYDQSTQA